MAAAGFLSRYQNGLMPYNRRLHVLSASLNKSFLSLHRVWELACAVSHSAAQYSMSGKSSSLVLIDAKTHILTRFLDVCEL